MDEDGKSEILKQMVEQARSAPTEAIYLFVLPRGAGHYHVEECTPLQSIEIPAKFSFMTDNADEIIVWSTYRYLSEKEAHELAVQFGKPRGLYV